MAELFDEHLRNVTIHFERAEGYSAGQGPLKTYLIEAHGLNGHAAGESDVSAVLSSLSSRFGFAVQPTDDPTLTILTRSEIRYFVDSLNPRFWVVHTTANIDPAEGLLDDVVRKSWNLDFAWLPTQVLEYFSRGQKFLGFNVDFDQGLFLSEKAPEHVGEQATVFKTRYWGTSGKGLFDFLGDTPTFRRFLCLSAIKYSISDPHSDSYIINELSSFGRIKATGNSIALHLGAVNHLVSFYSQMIETLEDVLKLGFARDDNGVQFHGYPLTFHFSQPVPDFAGFVGELLSCRDPIRLWGTINHERSDFVRAEIVDLHSASRLRLDLSPAYLMLYLFKGACGNSIARLLRVIQEYLDPTVYIELDRPSLFDQCKKA